SVDGVVTFHELAPELTRILLVLEYHPKGLFERTGNLWRAQGRRARLELKHFARHAMTQSILRPDEGEGWRGEIRDSKVVKDHGTGTSDERQDRKPRDERGRDEGDDERDDRNERAAAPVRRRRADPDDRNKETARPVRRRQADPDDRRERTTARGRASN